MKYLVTLLILFSCAAKPMFKPDTCFSEGFTVIQVVDVLDKLYRIHILTFMEEERLIPFKTFDKTITEKGLVPKSCDEFRGEEDEQ